MIMPNDDDEIKPTSRLVIYPVITCLLAAAALFFLLWCRQVEQNWQEASEKLSMVTASKNEFEAGDGLRLYDVIWKGNKKIKVRRENGHP